MVNCIIYTTNNTFRMKKILILICSILLLTFTSQKAQAQYYFYNDNYYDNYMLYEIGGSLNAMNCLTDLGGKKGIGARFFKDFNIGKTHLSGGLFFSALYKSALGVRIEGTYGKISADDAVLKGVTGIASARYNRNLNFRSTIAEISAMAEIHPLYIFIDWAERDEAPPRYSPYLLAGVGYFSYNPQGQVPGTNRWVDLQPLSTEGQGFSNHPDRLKYKLKQVNFPVGFGIKHDISRTLNLRLEGIYRILNTDYLDDISKTYINPADFTNTSGFSATKAALALQMADKQIVSKTNPLGGSKRGSPAEKDAYFSLNFKVSIVLGRERIR